MNINQLQKNITNQIIAWLNKLIFLSARKERHLSLKKSKLKPIQNKKKLFNAKL